MYNSILEQCFKGELQAHFLVRDPHAEARSMKKGTGWYSVFFFVFLESV